MSSAPSSRAELAAALRGVLLHPDDAAGLDVHGRTDAAVLVALYLAEGELHVVLTKRRAEMRRHAGEISFPGGRLDPGDASLSAAALREAQEEVGLAPAEVELLGALTPTPTIATDYAVYPFVGLIEAGREWRLSAREVAAVLELSVADLRAGAQRRRLVRRGIPFRTDVFVVGEHLIWGATARMLTDLLARLAPLLDGARRARDAPDY